MPRRVGILGYAAGVLASFTGRTRELVIDLDTNEITVHDGVTVGGAARMVSKARMDTALDSKLDKTGGTVTSDLEVNGALTKSGNAVLTAANTGAGNGLDADLLDGQHGAHYLSLANATGQLTAAITEALTAATTALKLPVGTTLERPAAPTQGQVRYNTTDATFEGYDGTEWGQIGGGGPSLGTDSIIRTNANTISENITIPTGTNGMTAGPVTIAAGYTVTIEDGANWSIV